MFKIEVTNELGATVFEYRWATIPSYSSIMEVISDGDQKLFRHTIPVINAVKFLRDEHAATSCVLKGGLTVSKYNKKPPPTIATPGNTTPTYPLQHA